MRRPTHPATITILNHSPKVRPKGNGWMVLCPSHPDVNPSLAVDEAEDRVLLKCFRGCTVEAITSAVGIEPRDLFCEQHWEPRETVYAIAPGVEHVRLDFPDGTKRFLWRRNGSAGLDGLRTADLPLYGTDRLASTEGGHLVAAALNGGAEFANPEDRARWSSREFVVIAEGEKAADALWRRGIPAVGTVTGAEGTPSRDVLRSILPRSVYLWADNDQPGREHMARIAATLADLGEIPLMIRWPDAPLKADAADFDGDVGELLGDAVPWEPESEPGIRMEPVPGEAATFPEPEDRGTAALSALGTIEYVEDLLRPGRILVWAAEEGSGKSYATTGELGIRLAVAGGDFAGTWPVLQTGPVLVLSEMHSDDDHGREEEILASLGRTRDDLLGKYFRLYIPTAANGQPPLALADWRSWVLAWMKRHNVICVVVDTATAATNVDPWGREIQGVYAGLRQMQAAYPALAVVLAVHLKKPQGRGERRLSDVLGEWGRWCDVVVLQENDGNSLTRTKLTSRKRVRRERKIVATKQGGLLVDAQEVKAAGPKVTTEQVVAAVTATPGLSISGFAKAMKCSVGAASNYITAAEKEGVIEIRPGTGGAKLLYPNLSAFKAFQQS